jgi:two-component system LytT family response regulator
MLMLLRTIMVDDEPMARKGISEELREIAFIQLVGIAENSFQAMDLVASLRPDLILLDIGMPGLNGLELIRTLSRPPMIIIITAYPEYALEGYALDVMDYLIKPVNFSRLLKACCKAREFHLLQQQASGKLPQPASALPHNYFFVRAGGKYEKLYFHELLFIEAADNYIMFHMPGRKLLVYQTLKGIESTLPAAGFMKVHKSFIVALDKVSGMEGHTLLIDGFAIPVSRHMMDAVRQRVLGPPH